MAGKPPQKFTLTKNLVWGKYDKSDFQPVPKGEAGHSKSARRYRLKINHKIIIARRQYDEHYGSAAQAGTYERKAQKFAGTEDQLLRPARGRKSARKLSPEEKIKEINERRLSQAETRIRKKVSSLQSKHFRIPSSITLRNFGKRKQIRKWRTEISEDQIEHMRQLGQQSRIVLSYWVGLEIVSERDGRVLSPTLFMARDIKLPFTDEDMITALDKASTKQYAILTGMWIAMHLTKAAAIKHGARKPD